MELRVLFYAFIKIGAPITLINLLIHGYFLKETE